MITQQNILNMNLEKFAKALEDVGYFTLDLTLIKAVHDTLRDQASGGEYGNIAAMQLEGPPGTGKSYLARCVQKLLGQEHDFLIYNCHPDSSQEELVHQINPGGPAELIAEKMAQALKPADTQNQSGQTPANTIDLKEVTQSNELLYSFGALLEAFMRSSKGIYTVLLIDELDKGRYAVDATLLTALQEGELYVQGLGENGDVGVIRADRRNLLVVIAKNDQRDLEEALFRRCYNVVIKYPPPAVEREMLLQSLKKTTGYELTEAVKALVAWANRVRREAGVRKKPSLPELMTILLNFVHTVQHDCRVVSMRIQKGQQGVVVEDRIFCAVPKKVLNYRLLSDLAPKKSEQAIAMNAIKNKSAGTQLLSKVYDDIYGAQQDDGSPRPKFRYLTEDAAGR